MGTSIETGQFDRGQVPSLRIGSIRVLRHQVRFTAHISETFATLKTLRDEVRSLPTLS